MGLGPRKALYSGHNLSLLSMELRDMGGNAFAQEYGALPAPLDTIWCREVWLRQRLFGQGRRMRQWARGLEELMKSTNIGSHGFQVFVINIRREPKTFILRFLYIFVFIYNNIIILVYIIKGKINIIMYIA